MRGISVGLLCFDPGSEDSVERREVTSVQESASKQVSPRHAMVRALSLGVSADRSQRDHQGDEEDPLRRNAP